jgi:hypothetical protein
MQLFPTSWLSPELTAIVFMISAVVVTVSQTIKKTLESIFKVQFSKLASVILSVAISFVASFSHLASDGLIGYLIIVACVALAANGLFKMAKVAGGE